MVRERIETCKRCTKDRQEGLSEEIVKRRDGWGPMRDNYGITSQMCSKGTPSEGTSDREGGVVGFRTRPSRKTKGTVGREKPYRCKDLM